MRANVGGAEKSIRIVLGIGLLLLGFFNVVPANWHTAAYVLGAVAFVTGVIGFCPAWAIFKVNTCSTGHPQPK